MRLSREQRAKVERNGIDHDQDGYWVYLKRGLCVSQGAHIVHEDTVADVKEALDRVIKCTCRECNI